jgi:hypothetical protein
MTRCLVLVFVVACGSKGPSPAAARILEADDATMGDCTPLGKVEGAGGNMESAQANAKEHAASLGATHIKWIVPCCSTVEAQAYRCDVPGE